MHLAPYYSIVIVVTIRLGDGSPKWVL